LLAGEHKAVLLGNAAAHHAQAAVCWRWPTGLASKPGATVGYLTEAANTVGAQWVHAMPGLAA
jgi:NADH-quinone oxidoreductase subunit G